jgi:hypothetical protein
LSRFMWYAPRMADTLSITFGAVRFR